MSNASSISVKKEISNSLKVILNIEIEILIYKY